MVSSSTCPGGGCTSTVTSCTFRPLCSSAEPAYGSRGSGRVPLAALTEAVWGIEAEHHNDLDRLIRRLRRRIEPSRLFLPGPALSPMCEFSPKWLASVMG